MAELSVVEAAALLKVSVDTVRRRIRRGEIATKTDSAGRRVVLFDAAEPAASAEQSEDVEHLRRELDLAADLLKEVRRQRDELIEQMRDSARERAELRRMLANAQQVMEHLLHSPER